VGGERKPGQDSEAQLHRNVQEADACKEREERCRRGDRAKIRGQSSRSTIDIKYVCQDISHNTHTHPREKTKSIHATHETWLLFWALSGICLKISDKSFSISASDSPSPLPNVIYSDGELKFGLLLASLH